uniref:Uncharacterized protein n=1 Tax=Lepeophtheirus salmonis TaxID=72036 RepID=A0A0K2U0F1_LEPSM
MKYQGEGVCARGRTEGYAENNDVSW